MRVLIIAPLAPELNTIYELREIQKQHSVTILNGAVVAKDIYDACRDQRFDSIHFAGHGGETGVWLSDGDILTPEDIGQICRMVGAKLVFFNACETGVPAAYAVRHGAFFALFAIRKLPDAQAWKLALVFYHAMSNGASENIIAAFLIADGGEATYSMVISPMYVQELVNESLRLQRDQIARDQIATTSITITRRTAATITATYVTLLTVLLLAITILADWIHP